MISMEQLEKLENRILKAIDLISDLRVENEHLEKEVGRLREVNEKLQFINEDQQKRIDELETKLSYMHTDIRELQKREELLEMRISSILSRLDNVKDKPEVSDLSNTSTKESVRSSSEYLTGPIIEAKNSTPEEAVDNNRGSQSVENTKQEQTNNAVVETIYDPIFNEDEVSEGAVMDEVDNSMAISDDDLFGVNEGFEEEVIDIKGEDTDLGIESEVSLASDSNESDMIDFTDEEHDSIEEKVEKNVIQNSSNKKTVNYEDYLVPGYNFAIPKKEASFEDAPNGIDSVFNEDNDFMLLEEEDDDALNEDEAELSLGEAFNTFSDVSQA